MFTDYLINIALIAAPYWTSSILIFMFGFCVCRKKSFNEFWKPLKISSGFLLIGGLLLGMLSSTNTYKNNVDYNRSQDMYNIEQRREYQESTSVQDRTRQPLTDAQLEELSVDMRNRVNIDNTDVNN